MVKILMRTLVVVMLLGMLVPVLDAADKPEITVKADLELFYESSDNVAGTSDSDKFKSNQLYVDFLGKFDKDLEARLKLDGADIVNGKGNLVSETIIEEANFTMNNIGGSPVTMVFGKDEMPFGLDVDKHLNDSIAHQFEIDKVWGLHGIVAIPGVGDFAAASFQHRRSLKASEARVTADNETGDNYTARLTIGDAIPKVKLSVSGASETHSDIEVTDEAGMVTTIAREDETRLGAGAIVDLPADIGSVNVEYITFSSLHGAVDHDPSLVTVGVEYNLPAQVVLWGRYETIDEDAEEEVETDFWTVGLAYSPVKNYTLSVEYSNFNSLNLAVANGLRVPKGSTEDALLLGVKAAF
jgi:hypothetical protein